MAKVFTVAVHDPHSICLYDASTGSYEGIIYVTSGSIIGNPVVTPTNVSVTYTENGSNYISIFNLPSKAFSKKIYIYNVNPFNVIEVEQTSHSKLFWNVANFS